MSDMSDWFEWKPGDLKELGIKDFLFFDYLKAGLQPYSRYDRKPESCPQEHHLYYHKLAQHDKINRIIRGLKEVLKREKELGSNKSISIAFTEMERIDIFKIEKGKEPEKIGSEPISNYLVDCLEDAAPNEFQLEAGKIVIGVPGIQRIKILKAENEKELKKIEKELLDIIVEDRKAMGNDPGDYDALPRSWKYVVAPDAVDECDELKSTLTEKAVFKRSVALEIKNSISPEPSSPEEEAEQSPQKKLRHSTTTRIKCLKIAEELWDKHGTMIRSKAEMADRPEIIEVAKRCNGKPYTRGQIKKWLSEVAPPHAKKPGVRPKNPK